MTYAPSEQTIAARDLAAHLIHGELLDLDAQAWDAWLARFDPKVEYWVPAWRDGMKLTEDPNSELSLIYCDSRDGLQERVRRLVSQRSPASTPTRRTAHMVGNVLAERQPDGSVVAIATFQTFCHDWVERRDHGFFGQSHYKFVRDDTRNCWLIRQKRQIVMNDYLPGMLDFYLL